MSRVRKYTLVPYRVACVPVRYRVPETQRPHTRGISPLTHTIYNRLADVRELHSEL